MDQQFGQVLIDRSVVDRGEQNGDHLAPEKRYPQEIGDLLALLARSIAELEVQEVASPAGCGMQQCQPEEGRRNLAIAEKREESLADRRRTLLAPLPIRVLVAEGRVDLVKVIAIGVTHVSAQNTIPPGLVQAVL